MGSDISYLLMAQGVDGGAGSALMQFLPIIIIFLIFWLLVIRPQQKKVRMHRDMVSNLQKGDEVWTDGGMRGTIKKINNEEISLEIAPNTVVKFTRSRVASVIQNSKKPKVDDDHADDEEPKKVD